MDDGDDNSVLDYFRQLLTEEKTGGNRRPSKSRTEPRMASNCRYDSKCDFSVDESSIHSSDYCSSSFDSSDAPKRAKREDRQNDTYSVGSTTLGEDLEARIQKRRAQALLPRRSKAKGGKIADPMKKYAQEETVINKNDAYSVGSTTLGEDLEARIQKRQGYGLGSRSGKLHITKIKPEVTKSTRSTPFYSSDSVDPRCEYESPLRLERDTSRSVQHSISREGLRQRDEDGCDDHYKAVHKENGSSSVGRKYERGSRAIGGSSSRDSATLGDDKEQEHLRSMSDRDIHIRSARKMQSSEASQSDCGESTTLGEDLEKRIQERQLLGSMSSTQDINKRLEQRRSARSAPWQGDKQLVVSSWQRNYYDLHLSQENDDDRQRESRRSRSSQRPRYESSKNQGMEARGLYKAKSTSTDEDWDQYWTEDIHRQRIAATRTDSQDKISRDSTEETSSELWEDVLDSSESEGPSYQSSFTGSSGLESSEGKSRRSRPRTPSRDVLRRESEDEVIVPQDIPGTSDSFRVIDRIGGGALQGVHYVPKIERASTNRGISTVGPIDKRAAQAAFGERGVPQVVSADTDRDDVSSIGGISYLKARARDFLMNESRANGRQNGPAQLDIRSLKTQELEARQRDLARLGDQSEQMNRDVELAIPADRFYEKVLGEETCCSAKRSQWEIFFILLISVSLLTLIILLGFMLTNK